MSLYELPPELVVEIYIHLILPTDLAQYYVPMESLAVYKVEDALNFSSVCKRFRDIIGLEMWKHFKIHVYCAARRPGFWLALATDSICSQAQVQPTQFPWRSKMVSLNILRHVRQFTADVNTPVYLFPTSTTIKGRLISQLQLVNPKYLPNLQVLHTELGFVYSFFNELGLSLHEYKHQVRVVLALSDFVSLDKLEDYGLLPFISTFAYVYNVVNKPETPFDRGNMKAISRMKNLEVLYLRAFGNSNKSSEIITIALDILRHSRDLPFLKKVKICGVPLKLSAEEMGWLPESVDSLKWDWISQVSTTSPTLEALFGKIKVLQLELAANPQFVKDWIFPFNNLEELCLPWWPLNTDNSRQVLVNLISQNNNLTTLHIHGISPSQLRSILPYLKCLQYLEVSCISEANDELKEKTFLPPFNDVVKQCTSLKTLNILHLPSRSLSFTSLSQIIFSNYTLSSLLISPAPAFHNIFHDWPPAIHLLHSDFCSIVERVAYCPGKDCADSCKKTPFAIRVGIDRLRSLLSSPKIPEQSCLKSNSSLSMVF